MAEQRTVFESIASGIGNGIRLICLALACIMLYRGCEDKGSLLPPIFPTGAKAQAMPAQPDSIQWPSSHP